VLPEPRQAQFDSLLNLLPESRSLDPSCGRSACGGAGWVLPDRISQS